MTTTRRSEVIKFRASLEEKNALNAKAEAEGLTLTDFIRLRTMSYRVRSNHVERERLLLLARIGSNLNQIARVANTYKTGMDAVRIIAALAAIEEALKADTPPPHRQGRSYDDARVSPRQGG